MHRANYKFLALYRECLGELQSEIKEKKHVLDTSQLAFLTADPGLIQTKLSDAITTYHKQKKTVHGVPSQMDEGQVWSRYMSEAAQVKVDDLQKRIKEAQEELDAKKAIDAAL